MKIACHKSSDRACRVCEYRYVCDLSAYHKHDDVPSRKPLQVDSILSTASNNPVSSRAVALAIEALRLTIGRWGNIGGNMEEQADLSARFGSIEELIGLLSERIKAVEESTEGTEEVATDDYQQVTQCQEDWSGEYVIICTKDGSTRLFAGTDVDANYIDVSVSDGTVTVPYDDLVAEACMVKIERFGDNYSLRVVGGANDGKYMYNNSSTNNIKFNDEPQEVVIEWDNENGVRIHSVGYNTILHMYISSADTRFRFYKTVQNPIVLCKRVYMSADTADIALKTAEGAQATASEAKTAANKASDTADTALGEARTAQSKADDAKETAENAQTRMDNLNIESGTGEKSVQLVDSLREEGKGATGKRSAAFGRNTLASGQNAFAEGQSSIASDSESHAEGKNTISSGLASHSEGYSTKATSHSAHAEGSETIAAGLHSHAEGQDTQANGDDSHAEGRTSTADGIGAHAEGNKTTASRDYAHAEGSLTTASGKSAHAEGDKTEAFGEASHAEGSETYASGEHSHAEGGRTKAEGRNSHAEGDNTTASGDSSHAGGTSGTVAVGFASFAHGSGCRAMSKHSVAMGVNCVAGNGMSDEGGEEINTDAFAMGKDNRATHKASAVFGGDNRSSRNHQMVVGHDNADNANALFIVGNGASKEETQRSNAFEVLENGNAIVSGNLDVYKDAQVYGDMQVSGKATIDNGLKVGGDIVFGNESAHLSDELNNIHSNIENIENNISSFDNRLNSLESFDPNQFAPAEHQHAIQDVQNLEQTLMDFSDRIIDVEFGEVIASLSEARSPIDIEIENQFTLITPNGEVEMLLDIIRMITTTDDNDDFTTYYQMFNNKILLPRIAQFMSPDPDMGVSRYIRLLPWTVYMYNRISVQGGFPFEAYPVLYIAFGADTIQLLRRLGFNDHYNIPEDILGMTYDRYTDEIVFTSNRVFFD